MSVRAIFPEAAQVTQRDGHIRFGVFSPSAPATAPAMPGVLDLATRGAATRGRFLVVLALARAQADAQAATSALEKAAGQDCSGVRIGPETVLFRDAAAHTSSYQGWKSDAASWTVGDEILAAQAATEVSRSGKLRFSSNRPASFAAKFRDGGVELSVSAPDATEVRLYTGFAPAGVDYDSATGMARLRVPAGRTERTFLK